VVARTTIEDWNEIEASASFGGSRDISFQIRIVRVSMIY
jgi:hypothetical protein